MSIIENEKLLDATAIDSLDSVDDVVLDCTDEEDCTQTETAVTFAWGTIYMIVAIIALYSFIVAIKFIGDGFTLALGCNNNGSFGFGSNPGIGILIGTVVTALLHSSGAVTSFVVALVGSGGMTVRQGVYVIMGANVGTCVTCIMVAFCQVDDRTKFQRAMAAAMVNEMYNVWSVFVMFPLEVIFHPLEKLSVAMSSAKASSGTFSNPVDTIVNPLTQTLLVVDNEVTCKIATGESGYNSSRSFVMGGAFKGSSWSDSSIGVITAVIGFCILICALQTLVKVLAKVFMGSTKKLISKLLNYNGYINIIVGTLTAFAVQSSTVFTSTLTPMAGLGIVTLEQVYPLVIGANLGTTGTALLASLATGKFDSVAIALVHFWFNFFGIFLFYLIPITRKPVFGWSKSLAFASAAWPLAAVLFVVVIFVIAPGILLITVCICTASNVVVRSFGWIVMIVEVVAFGYFIFWYQEKGGRGKWHTFLEKRRLERDDGLEWFHTYEMGIQTFFFHEKAYNTNISA